MSSTDSNELRSAIEKTYGLLYWAAGERQEVRTKTENVYCSVSENKCTDLSVQQLSPLMSLGVSGNVT